MTDTSPIEMAALGGILHPDTVHEVLSRVSPEHFTDFRREVYEILTKMARTGYPITEQTVVIALQQREMTEEVAIEWVQAMRAKAPANAHTAKFVVDSLGKARISRLTHELGQALHKGSSQPTSAILAQISAFQRAVTQLDDSRPMSFEDTFRLLATSRDQVRYLTPGMGPLDRAMKFFPGELTYIGADSGGGKSSWLVNALWNIAAVGHKVGMISVEMNRKQLAARFGGKLAGLDTLRVKEGTLSDVEREIMLKSVDRLKAVIDRVVSIEPYKFDADLVKPTLDRWRDEHGVEILGIDYVQRLKVNAPRVRSETDKVAYASEALAEAAKASGVPIVALSQLRRREGKEVEMNDFKHSAQLEHDAHVMASITPVHESDDGVDRPVWFKILKQRDGPKIEDQLDYHLPTQVFTHNGVTNNGWAKKEKKEKRDLAPF